MVSYSSLRVLKSWWRDESFIQRWWLTRMESTSWWRTEFREWRRGRERESGKTQRPNLPLSLNVCREKLWCHRCAITMTRACVLWKRLNERARWSVSFTFQVFFTLYVFFIFVLKSTWTQHKMKDKIPVVLTGWSSLRAGASIYFAYETYFLYVLIKAL